MGIAEISSCLLRVLAVGSIAIWLSALNAREADSPTKPRNRKPSQATIERGEKLYRDNCVSCHGDQAYGDPTSSVPALAGQYSNYLLKQLVGFTGSQRDSAKMHPRMGTQDLYSPRIWRDLAEYLSTLPANEDPQAGDGAHLGQGESVYLQLCMRCHGQDGEGRASGGVPALRGQHYPYLVQQLRAFANLHRDDMELPVLEKIASLSQTQLDAVADYASRLRVDK